MQPNNLGERLLLAAATKPKRSSQSLAVGPRKPLPLLPQSSKSMSAAEHFLSTSYWRGAAKTLSKAATAGATARANLARTPSVAAGTYAPEGSATGPSWIEASITIANTLIGAGVLGLPYALRSAGWAGLAIILLATVITCFTAKMLVWSFMALNDDRPRGASPIESYDDLAAAVCGSGAGGVMKVLTLLECFGLAICYVVLHTVNWPALLSLPPTELIWAGLDARTLAGLAVTGLAVPTLLVRSQYLSSLAIVGLAATMAMFAVAVVAPLLAELPAPIGSECPVLDAATPADSEMEWRLLEPSGLGLATGLALFAFSGHATFPELYRQMTIAERPKFFLACDVGFGAAGAAYCGFAAIGYYFYGSCAADTATLNLMHASPVLGSAATLLVLLSAFVTISVVCVPVVRILSEALLGTDDSINEDEPDGEAPISFWQPMRAPEFALRVSLMIIAFIVAVSVPNFGFAVSLMGAFTTMLISFILPVVFYLCACWAQLSHVAIVVNVGIILFGFVGMVVGVQSTLAENAV